MRVIAADREAVAKTGRIVEINDSVHRRPDAVPQGSLARSAEARCRSGTHKWGRQVRTWPTIGPERPRPQRLVPRDSNVSDPAQDPGFPVGRKAALYRSASAGQASPRSLLLNVAIEGRIGRG